MQSSVTTVIESRCSTYQYDPERTLSSQQVQELVRLATLAPSAYNFQNWKFIAVQSSAAKARLKTVAHGQQQVVDASVTFIVCGTLAAHESLPHALWPAVEAGALSQAAYDSWVGTAEKTHRFDLQLQRDEAVRSASLAAMTLMLGAGGMALSTGAIGGFDPDGVAQAFGLSPNDVPVLLVTVGHAIPGRSLRKPRKPLSEVLQFA